MYDEEDPRPARRGHPVLAAFFTSLFTTAAAFAALTVADQRGLLPFLHGGAREVEVPSIMSVSVEQARDLLQARGLLLALQAERPDANIAAGKIAGQVPLPGSRLATGASVQAFVSSGAAVAIVPAVAGSRPEDAIEQLRSRKLLAGPRRGAASATVAAGLVIGTEPAEGQSVRPETAIALVVSTGPAQKEVPKVVGLFVGKAKKLIEAAWLKVGALHHGSSDDHDEGVILKQTPAEGTPAAPGSAIDLVVNE